NRALTILFHSKALARKPPTPCAACSRAFATAHTSGDQDGQDAQRRPLQLLPDLRLGGHANSDLQSILRNQSVPLQCLRLRAIGIRLGPRVGILLCPLLPQAAQRLRAGRTPSQRESAGERADRLPPRAAAESEGCDCARLWHRRGVIGA